MYIEKRIFTLEGEDYRLQPNNVIIAYFNPLLVIIFIVLGVGTIINAITVNEYDAIKAD